MPSFKPDRRFLRRDLKAVGDDGTRQQEIDETVKYIVILNWCSLQKRKHYCRCPKIQSIVLPMTIEEKNFPERLLADTSEPEVY